MTVQNLIVTKDLNYYVSEHFLYTDFICPCCDNLKIVPAFYRHLNRLEYMRVQCGFPITVTSGYRCKKHNTAVRGAPRSWHLLFATDIMPSDGDPAKLALLHEIAVDIDFGGIGRYEKHIHLDLRQNPLQWRG